MSLSLIWAQSKNGVIGLDNQLPWHLPEDLLFFKRMTEGCAVLMGRKTWDSLPARFRPLPSRKNLVMTRQRDWKAPGAETVHSIGEAFSLVQEQTLWAIGGSEIYKLCLPFAQNAYITEIDSECVGDAFAPPLPPENWKVSSKNAHATSWLTSSAGLRYRHCVFERIGVHRHNNSLYN